MTRLRRLLVVLFVLWLAAPARAAITVVAHTGAGSTNDTDVTTSAIDTTGATAIIVGMVDYNTAAANTLSDSKGNTPASLTAYDKGSAGGPRVRLFYYSVPTVGSGHTFTANTVAGSYPCLFVLALAGVGAAASEIDSGTYALNVNTIATTGALTPALNNEILVSIFGAINPFTSPAISGFTVTDSVLIATHTIPGAMAYVIQTTAGAVTPTWTWSGTSSDAAIAVVSLTAATAGASLHLMGLLGVGQP